MEILSFKKYLNEINTVGKHNDYATGAIVPSVASGSETLPPHIPGLSSHDMILPDLPKQTITGRVHNITFGPNGQCNLYIYGKDGGKTYRLDYEQLKRMVVGFDNVDDIIRKKKFIKLVAQGHDPHGNLKIQWGTLT